MVAGPSQLWEFDSPAPLVLRPTGFRALQTSRRVPAAFSIHPGAILLTEFMEPLGRTAYRLAKDLHISIPRVNDLVRDERGITVDTALRLRRYFGNSAQFRIGLQSGYHLWVASEGKSWNKVKAREKAA